MAKDFVSVKNLAEKMGMHRSHARRYIKRIGINPHKRRLQESQNQLSLAVTLEESRIILAKRKEEGFIGESKPVEKEFGYFYIIQLIPEFDPTRVKLGFADDVNHRLSQHRTAAPTCTMIKSWPCKRGWEKTIMDCLTAKCRLILNEVFECDSIEDLIEAGDQIFGLMPDPAYRVPLSSSSPANT